PWRPTYPAYAGVVERRIERVSSGVRSGFRRKPADLQQLQPHLLKLREDLVQPVLRADGPAQDRLDRLDLGRHPGRVGEVLPHPPANPDLVVQRHALDGPRTPGERPSSRPGEPCSCRSDIRCFAMEPTVVCAFDPDAGDRSAIDLARVLAGVLDARL